MPTCSLTFSSRPTRSTSTWSAASLSSATSPPAKEPQNFAVYWGPFEGPFLALAPTRKKRPPAKAGGRNPKPATFLRGCFPADLGEVVEGMHELGGGVYAVY